MKKNIQDSIISVIQNALLDSGVQQKDYPELFLDIPVEVRFGDLSLNIAMRLARILKKPPLEIAGNIVVNFNKRLEKSAFKSCIREIKVEGAGFINFYLSDGYFSDLLKGILRQGPVALKLGLGKDKPVLLEFVSANPTGPLSVAHARQAVVGDVLANILSFLNFKVKKEYYLNDEGNQINILGRSVELRLKELNGQKVDFPEDYYQGDYIIDIARQIKEKNIKLNDFSVYGVEYILNIIKQELADFGVNFDYWYSQKQLRESGKIDKAISILKKRGFLYEQEGALWLKSRQFGDDKDRVVIKSDGNYTYLAPDIAYHRDKFKRGFKWLINMWGPDHHGYISRLKASVSAFGHDPKDLSVIIVQLASIFREGKPVQMSTRRGQYITLREVLEEVGADAARFFFLMRRTSSHLDFDLSAAKKQTSENPVYYVQYAHARISSIINNSPVKFKIKDVDFSLLKEKEEKELMRKIWQFSYILEVCLKTEDPYMLTVYLQELAENFHKFYDLHRVLGVDLNLTQARLGLLAATKHVIVAAMGLLAISLPEKM
jgi:arginyl-tRNA synthetase